MESIGIGALAKRVLSGSVTLIAACPGHGRAADCSIFSAFGVEASP